MNIPSIDDILTYSIYTDGSANLNVSAGYGVVICDYTNKILLEHSGTLSNNFTAPHAELVGVMEALKLVQSFNPKIVKVFCDSEFVVKTINLWGPTRKNWSKYAYSQEFISILAYIKGKNITFIHIPGHKNIGYNELADTLAKRGNIKID